MYIRDRQCVGILRFSICFFSCLQPDMPCGVEKVLKSVRGFRSTLPPHIYSHETRCLDVVPVSLFCLLTGRCLYLYVRILECTRPLTRVFCAGHTLREVVVCRW